MSQSPANIRNLDHVVPTVIGFVRKSAASSTPAMCFSFHTSCCTASCNALERRRRCLDLQGPFGLSTTWIPDWESPYNTRTPFSVNLPSSKMLTRTATESPRHLQPRLQEDPGEISLHPDRTTRPNEPLRCWNPCRTPVCHQALGQPFGTSYRATRAPRCASDSPGFAFPPGTPSLDALMPVTQASSPHTPGQA